MMKKQRFLARTALALAMTAANAQQAAPDDCAVVLNDPTISASVKQEVRAQQAVQHAEALLNQQRTATTAAGIETPPPSVKTQSCFDRYSNFRPLIALGFPTTDGMLQGLMTTLQNQACSVIDQQINNATSGINGAINGAINRANQGISGATGGLIPNVGTNVNIGVGTGNAQGAPVNIGTDRISVGLQGNNQTVNVSGSVGNRAGQAFNGIFR